MHSGFSISFQKYRICNAGQKHPNTFQGGKKNQFYTPIQNKLRLLYVHGKNTA